MSKKSKTIVLKNKMTDKKVHALVEEKKTGYFRTMLMRPARKDVRAEEPALSYECITSVSGTYAADYFRKATHSLSVDRDVTEIVLGDGVFPVRTRSGISRAISGRLGGNRIDLEVEEHVRVEREGSYCFDPSGREVRFRPPTGAAENYPRRILDQNTVVESSLSDDDLEGLLTERLAPDTDGNVRDLSEETSVGEIRRIYVPVYEVVLMGPKRRTATMRIDASRGTVL